MAKNFSRDTVLYIGKVAEWLKAPVSKTGRGESSSRVQIPPFPQASERSERDEEGSKAPAGFT